MRGDLVLALRLCLLLSAASLRPAGGKRSAGSRTRFTVGDYGVVNGFPVFGFELRPVIFAVKHM